MTCYINGYQIRTIRLEGDNFVESFNDEPFDYYAIYAFSGGKWLHISDWVNARECAQVAMRGI